MTLDMLNDARWCNSTTTIQADNDPTEVDIDRDTERAEGDRSVRGDSCWLRAAHKVGVVVYEKIGDGGWRVEDGLRRRYSRGY